MTPLERLMHDEAVLKNTSDVLGIKAVYAHQASDAADQLCNDAFRDYQRAVEAVANEIKRLKQIATQQASKGFVVE